MSRRLQPFTFALTKDGETVAFTFYASLRAAALRMAQEWAEARGRALEEERMSLGVSHGGGGA